MTQTDILIEGRALKASTMVHEDDLEGADIPWLIKSGAIVPSEVELPAPDRPAKKGSGNKRAR